MDEKIGSQYISDARNETGTGSQFLTYFLHMQLLCFFDASKINKLRWEKLFSVFLCG